MKCLSGLESSLYDARTASTIMQPIFASLWRNGGPTWTKAFASFKIERMLSEDVRSKCTTSAVDHMPKRLSVEAFECTASRSHFHSDSSGTSVPICLPLAAVSKNKSVFGSAGMIASLEIGNGVRCGKHLQERNALLCAG